MNPRNKVQLVGNLGSAPEIRTVSTGQKMARLSLAVNENYTNKKGEKVSQTYWHNIVAWGKTAEVAEKLFQKGSAVQVEGKLVSRNYVDKAGLKKYVTEVEAFELSVPASNAKEEVETV